MSGRFRFVLLAIALGGLLLAGCIFTLAPVRPLALHGLGDAIHVAMDMAPNGARNIAWSECDLAASPLVCYVVFERRLIDSVQVRRVFSGTSTQAYLQPDVAVTDNGDAYLVWRVCTETCEDRYAVIPGDAGPNTPTPEQDLDPDEPESLGPPHVTTNGSHVYAVYHVPPPSLAGVSQPQGLDPTPSYLRYRQLAGGTAEGFVDQRVDQETRDVEAAVSVTGTLHVAWRVVSPTLQQVAYNHNAGGTGDMPTPVGLALVDGDDLLGAPQIALDAAGVPYVAYFERDDGNFNVYLDCLAGAGACVGGVTQHLVDLIELASGWSILGLDLAVPGDVSQPVIAFSGAHAGSESWDIYGWSAPVSGSTAPFTVTNDMEDDSPPRLAIENSDFGGQPVVAWRQFLASVLSAPAAPEGFLQCHSSVYYIAGLGGPQLVHEPAAPACGGHTFDIDASGELVGGVFIAPVPGSLAGEAPLAVWTAYNAHNTYFSYLQR